MACFVNPSGGGGKIDIHNADVTVSNNSLTLLEDAFVIVSISQPSHNVYSIKNRLSFSVAVNDIVVYSWSITKTGGYEEFTSGGLTFSLGVLKKGSIITAGGTHVETATYTISAIYQ